MGPADDELRVYLDFSCIETNHIEGPRLNGDSRGAAWSLQDGATTAERTSAYVPDEGRLPHLRLLLSHQEVAT